MTIKPPQSSIKTQLNFPLSRAIVRNAIPSPPSLIVHFSFPGQSHRRTSTLGIRWSVGPSVTHFHTLLRLRPLVSRSVLNTFSYSSLKNVEDASIGPFFCIKDHRVSHNMISPLFVAHRASIDMVWCVQINFYDNTADFLEAMFN